MAQAVGTMYGIVNVPMRLYYDSGRADAKNTLQSGWVNEAGSYKIINHVVGSNGVDLYAINDITNSYAIGWIRDDDNIKGVRLYNIPSQISTNDANYKLSLEGTKGIAYKYTAKIGTTVIHEEETTLTYPNTDKTFTLTTAIKNLIYKALGNNNTGVMNISAVSTHNGKTIRTSTSSITVVIPAENGPKFTTNPTVTVIGAIGGLAYKDISRVKVSAPTSSISLKDGATIKTRSFQIGSHSNTTTTADNYTSPVIGSVGSVPVKVTVTDSRNRSTTVEASVTFNEARKISIDSFTAIRNGTTGIKITANGQYMTQIDGTPKFTITKSIRGKNTWSSVATGNVTVSNGRYSIAVTQTSGFTTTSAYDLRLVVSGTSTSATGNSVVGTEAVPISFGKHGSGVGTMFDNSNTASLQVGSGGISSEGEIKVNKVSLDDNTNLRVNTPYGYIDIGPKNKYHSHIYTDLPNFYFNKEIFVNGQQLAKVSDIASGAATTGAVSGRGRWFQTGDLLICTQVAFINDFFSAHSLTGSWTYPKAFAEAPFVQVAGGHNGMDDALYRMTGELSAYNVTSTGTSVHFAGGPFSSGNSKRVYMLAIGRV